ncbi:unnamed protein product, partial [Musa textilis]
GDAGRPPGRRESGQSPWEPDRRLAAPLRGPQGCIPPGCCSASGGSLWKTR